MELKEFCRKKLALSLLWSSILLFLVSFFFSLSLYMNRVRDVASKDLRSLKNVNVLLYKISKISPYIRGFLASEIKESDLAFASLIDIIGKNFPGLKIETSGSKLEGLEKVYYITLEGEGNLKKAFDLIGFLEEREYPVAFLKNISLLVKESTLSFRIMAEIRFLSDENVKRI